MRLAYERGLLTQKSLNPFQQWALMYHYSMVRRQEMDDLDAELERQCFNLAPERWVQVYKDRIEYEYEDESGETNIGIDDLDELDRFMAQQEQSYREEQFLQQTLTGKHTMNGSQVPSEWPTDPGQWSAWQ